MKVCNYCWSGTGKSPQRPRRSGHPRSRPRAHPAGEQQAAALPAAFEHRSIDAIFVSSLLRTHLTAAPLAAARGLRPTELSGLREIEAGDLEDRSDPPAIEEYHAVFGAWASGDNSRKCPAAPTDSHSSTDSTRPFARFSPPVRESAVAISHGAAIRTWAGARAANIDGRFVEAHPLGNTALVEVHGDFETGWTCVAWTDGPVGGANLVDRSRPGPHGRAPPRGLTPLGQAGGAASFARVVSASGCPSSS